MEILSLRTESFRNLAGASHELHPRLNLIVGHNGQGKTSFLEALALVAGRRSFRTNDLADVRTANARSVPAPVGGGPPEASTIVTARVAPAGPRETPAVLGVTLDGHGRRQTRDGRRISRTEAAHALPSVFLTFADLRRLSGPPAERRRSLDRAAVFLVRDMAGALAGYETARTAKSRLLSRKSGFDADEMAVYEESMATHGGRVARARRETLALLGPALARQARQLESPFGDLSLRLVSDLPADGDDATLGAALRQRFAERRAEERAARRTLAGPHRDDLQLLAGGVPVETRASSGESRTLLLAWTLAEMDVLVRAAGRPPLLAFDDFDSEWDPLVLRSFAAALPEDVQIFLTSAREEAVRGLPLPGGALLRMDAGRLAREGILGAGRAETPRAAAG